jgi:hypothetical protein
MPNTTDKVASMAGTAKPYVDRALHDEELRNHVRQAYDAARVIYDELIAPRGVVSAAQRVATDQDIQESLRVARRPDGCRVSAPIVIPAARSFCWSASPWACSTTR